MAPPQFDLCYLQGVYAPVDAAERTRDIAEFVQSQSNNISSVPISALITAAVEGKTVESLNVPRIVSRIATCCSCAAEDRGPLDLPHEHDALKEIAVACAAHLVSAAAAWHNAATTTGKRRRTSPLKAYKPSILVDLWRHIRRLANAESSDALLLLLAQASSRMLPFTNGSDIGDVVSGLMTDCLRVTEGQVVGRTFWMHPRSKSWLVSALPSVDEQTIVQLLGATAKDVILHTVTCHALGEELRRLLKGGSQRNCNADSASANTSQMVTTLLQAVVAAAEAGGLATLLAIAPPSTLARCSKEKAAAVRKACCGCFCAILKAQLNAPAASCHDAMIGTGSPAAGAGSTEHQAVPHVQLQQDGKLTCQAMWALEHIVTLAEHDKDANVRLSVSHQICQLLTAPRVSCQGVDNHCSTVLSVYLQRALGQLLQDSSAKVHAAAAKDLCALLGAVATGRAGTGPTTRVRSLLAGMQSAYACHEWNFDCGEHL